MRIPSQKPEQFLREVADECLYSQQSRCSNYRVYKNYFLYGSGSPEDAAMYNKTFAYMDDLESLLYSPVSLRFHIGDAKTPSLVNKAKCDAAATKLRQLVRESNTDNKISQATLCALVKGKAFLKQTFKGGAFSPEVVQPDCMGVYNETHDKLDADMEAFVHCMLITPHQFRRMVRGRPDEVSLLNKAKKYQSKMNQMPEARGPGNVMIGNLYPFQPYTGQASTQHGFVNWMAQGPQMSPQAAREMMQLDEIWIWDDDRNDWSTFHMIGEDILLTGKFQHVNLLAYDMTTGKENPILKGMHPFTEFCPNEMLDNFWGRSEIVNVLQLQEALNSRLNGINGLLRLQEKPPKTFTGTAGVNQNTVAKLARQGGYWSDSNPNAKVADMAPTISPDLWNSVHEYERMFDDMGGLPPIARGHGEQGVRSGAHANTLVRMFSPRFKDRALLVERSASEVGSLMVDLARAHCPDNLIAWVEKDAAGMEGMEPNPLFEPPAPGMVSIEYTFADLPDDITCMVESHSSSPAFSEDAKELLFNLFKIGAASPAYVAEHSDINDSDELVADIRRRDIAKAQAAQHAEELKAASKAKK